MSTKESFVFQFSRVLNVFQALPKTPQSHIFIEDLYETLRTSYDRFDAPRKTLQRDLETLNEILHKGNIEKIPASGRRSASFRLSADAQLNLAKQNMVRDEFQSLAIVHSYNFLKPYFPESWQSTLTQQFEQAQNILALKNKNVWLSKFGFALDGAFQDYLNPPHDIKELIFQSIHNDNTWLEIVYHPESFYSEPKPYTLKPHGVIVRGRKQYLIASKIDENDKVKIRTFSMHRILQAQKIPERITINIPDLDMQKAIEQYEFEGYYNDNDQAQYLLLNCSNKVLSEVNFSKIHDSQQLFDHDSFNFHLTVEMPITWSLIDWLVQKAQVIEVIEPTELRNEIKSRLIDMAQNYALDVSDYENDEDFFDEFTSDDEEGTAMQTLESILAVDDVDETTVDSLIVDILYQQAIEFISEKDHISTAELQQYFAIGYNQAAKIISKMQENEFIAPMNQQGKRKVLIKGNHDNGE